MEPLGINTSLLFIQLLVVLIMISLPIISLIDLALRKLSGTPLAIWVLIICVFPFIGPLAYWIIKPTAETRI